MTLRWLPNAISIFRIALILPVVYGILNDQMSAALAYFVLAGFSDGVDGFLAKRFDWHSRLGALLDPIADKLLTASTFLTLAIAGLVPVWLSAVVVLRDVVIIGGATAYNYLIEPVPGEPTRISKLNTALELLFVVSVLATAAYDWPGAMTTLVIGAGVLVSVVVSGTDYVIGWTVRARQAGRRRHLHDD